MVHFLRHICIARARRGKQKSSYRYASSFYKHFFLLFFLTENEQILSQKKKKEKSFFIKTSTWVFWLMTQRCTSTHLFKKIVFPSFKIRWKWFSREFRVLFAAEGKSCRGCCIHLCDFKQSRLWVAILFLLQHLLEVVWIHGKSINLKRAFDRHVRNSFLSPHTK